MTHTWRLGTRGSALARTQSEVVANLVRQATGDKVQITVIKTRGDAIVDRPLREVGGKGLFTKEIEDAMLHGHVDFAVHSMKDMPTVSPKGLVIAGIPRRESPLDALIGGSLASLPQGACIGTGSARRARQLASHRADLVIKGIRGNVETRIAKQQAGDFNAIVLAVAGIRRLGLDVAYEPIDPSLLVPAVGQGALAVQCRGEDRAMCDILASLTDADTADAVALERAFLVAIDGGCSVPAGCLAQANGDWLDVHAYFATDDGRSERSTYRVRREQALAEGERIGREIRALLAG